MDASTEIVRLLTEIGFVAASRGMPDEAITIFVGVHALRGDSEVPLIGRAIAELNDGRLGDAVASLEAAMRVNAENEYAKTYLGMAMLLSDKKSEAMVLLTEVAGAGRVRGAVDLARRLLESETACAG